MFCKDQFITFTQLSLKRTLFSLENHFIPSFPAIIGCLIIDNMLNVYALILAPFFQRLRGIQLALKPLIGYILLTLHELPNNVP